MVVSILNEDPTKVVHDELMMFSKIYYIKQHLLHIIELLFIASESP